MNVKTIDTVNEHYVREARLKTSLAKGGLTGAFISAFGLFITQGSVLIGAVMFFVGVVIIGACYGRYKNIMGNLKETYHYD